MSLKPVAPKSVGGVLDTAIRVYSRSLLPCMPLIIVGAVLMAIPSLMMSGVQQQAAAGNPFAALEVFRSPRVSLTVLVVMLFYIAIYGGLVAQIDAIARGERLKVGAALGLGLQRLPTMFGVGILFGLMVGIGFLLLIIPGIYVAVVFMLSSFLPVIERKGVVESLSTSARLIRGNWWRSFGIMLVALAIMYVLILVVGIIAGVVGAVAIGTGGAGANAVELANSTGFQMLNLAISVIANLFTTTFVPSVLLALYYDLKLRNEGADLASSVGALNPSG